MKASTRSGVVCVDLVCALSRPRLARLRRCGVKHGGRARSSGTIAPAAVIGSQAVRSAIPGVPARLPPLGRGRECVDARQPAVPPLGTPRAARLLSSGLILLLAAAWTLHWIPPVSLEAAMPPAQEGEAPVARQTADLVGTWNTTAQVTAGPDAGRDLAGWLRLTSSGATIAGTFQATVNGAPVRGSFTGSQADGRIIGVGLATVPEQYQLTVEAYVSEDGRTLSGSWTDSDGRSGDYQGVRGGGMLPEAGSSPLQPLAAALGLLGAALVSRGTRKGLARREAQLE